MERIIKKLGIFIIFCALTLLPAYSTGEQMSLSTLITAQNIPYENCWKVFNTDNNTLFFLTLSAINANRFEIEEIQSKSGYILFTAVNKPFLATVVNVNKNQGMLRITPADGSYFFQPGIILNIFKFIELNVDKKPLVIF